jgi:hypothetical protein
MKLYQLIWFLIKQWRNWRKPVNPKTLFAYLGRYGVRFTSKDWDEIQTEALLLKIYYPTEEERARNIAIVARSRAVQYELEPSAVLPQPQLEPDRAKADERFWKLVQPTVDWVARTDNREQYREYRNKVKESNRRAMEKGDYDALIILPPPLPGDDDPMLEVATPPQPKPKQQDATVAVEGVTWEVQDSTDIVEAPVEEKPVRKRRRPQRRKKE